MFVLRCPFAMSKTFFMNVASISAMRACVIGGTLSAPVRSESPKTQDTEAQYSIWRWHVDEVFVKISGETCYLWRAIDHEGEILEAYVTKTSDKAAALKFLRKAMKSYGSPEVIVTDGLASYGVAMKEIGNQKKRDTERYLNNRIESSHLPFRRRERAMQRFRRIRSLQKFAAIHSSVYNHFNLDRHLNSRSAFKARHDAALQGWRALIAA